jgi:hypothetical protein
MRTQKHDLKGKIKKFELELYEAILKEDATLQIRIKENLDVLKSTLYNIQ